MHTCPILSNRFQWTKPGVRWSCGVKARVAPLDKQTILRLKLLSNVTAARLVKSVIQALENIVKVHDVVNWTDSMISLSYSSRTFHADPSEQSRFFATRYVRFCLYSLID